jgi:hypothetical protein
LNSVIAVCGNVEIANVESRKKIRQLPFGARLQVDKPEIPMGISPRKTTSSRSVARKANCLAPRVKVKACRGTPSAFAVTALTGVSELEVVAEQL